MNKQSILEEIKTIVPKLDDYYRMSDDFKYWLKQEELHNRADYLKTKLQFLNGRKENES